MNEFTQRLATTLVLLPLSFALLVYAPHWILASLLLVLLGSILIIEWPRLFSYRTLVFWALMPFYPIAPFLTFIAIDSASRVLFLFLVSSVVAHDTGSYILGKLYGKRKIMPTVSPGKTWEGFIGGYSATLLVTISFFYSLSHSRSYTILALLALCISTTALAGDLFESYLKRQAGLKDSGSLLPGHGGLLDRFDALMFVSVLFYFLRCYLLELLS